MSTEIDNLVEANDLLDRCLKEARSAKASADSEALAAKSKAEVLEKETDRLLRDVDEERSRNQSLSESVEAMKLQMQKEATLSICKVACGANEMIQTNVKNAENATDKFLQALAKSKEENKACLTAVKELQVAKQEVGQQ